MKPIVVLFVTGTIALAPAALAEEMHSHPPPEGLGNVSFSTSCAPRVSHDFDRAVALLHSFSYAASEQAFKHVAAADPSCAMAHWGISMSFFHQLWSPPGADDLRKGHAEAATAGRLNAHSPREQQYIAAAAAYYDDFGHLPHSARAKAYEEAMSKLARDNPSDTEAQVFFALSLIATAPPEDKSHAGQKRAADILEPIYRDHPDHPGVAHYLIHAYDNTELAPRGLSVARAYSKIAPSAPHALHMPSHIFTRLGLWDESIASNIAARAAAHDQSNLSEELHAMDYLTYAYLQKGRLSEAEHVVAALGAKNGLPSDDFIVAYAATAMPVRLAIEQQDWNSAAALQASAAPFPQVTALVFWARAMANSRAGHPQAASDDIKRLETCQRQLQSVGNTYWSTQVDVLRMETIAWQLFASSHSDEAIQRLREAADQEDGVEKLPVTPGPIVPAREQLGDMFLKLNRPREALQEYRTALVSAPGRRSALAGAAKATELIGDTRTATRMRAISAN